MTQQTPKETTVPETLNPFRDDPDTQRITAAVQRAADACYRRRTMAAEVVLVDTIGTTGLVRARDAAGITEERWRELCQSSRSAIPQEFQAFARVLSVSARWLAIGSDSPHTPPPGWDYFGTNIDTDGQLEFSSERDIDLMPLWERPELKEAA